MTDWKDDRNKGPWPFTPQGNKWAYLNNPRWANPARKFVRGGPDDYDGRESDEPQIWPLPDGTPQSIGSELTHHQCGHWHKPATPLTSGLLLAIPIEMAFVKYYENGQPTTWLATEREIDPADYPGLTGAYLEMDSSADDPDVHSVDLVDEFGVVYATIDTTPPVDNIRQTDTFVLNAAKRRYFLRTTYNGVNWCELNYRHARLVLEGNFTAAKISIPLVSGDESSPGCTKEPGDPEEYSQLYSYASRSSKTTYAYGDGGTTEIGNFEWNYVIFKKDESKFATIDHWELEIVGGLIDTDIGYAALFNKTTGLMVAGSEISFVIADNPWIDFGYMTISSCLPTRKVISIPNNAVNFTDGDEFELRIKAPNGTSWDTAFLLYAAIVWVKLDPISKTQIYWRTNSGFGSLYGGSTSFATFDDEVRTKYDPSKYPAGTPVYFECTGKEVGGGSSMWLHDMGPNDVGAAEIVGHPGGVLAVTGVQPPVGIGDWFGPGVNDTPTAEALAATEGGPIESSSDYVQLNVALSNAILELSNFDFDTLLDPSVNIFSVIVQPIIGLYGQSATMSAWGIVSGVPLTTHTQSVPESVWTPPPPFLDITVYSVFFHLTTDRVWTRANLLDAAFKVRLRFNQPNNVTLTLYLLNEVQVVVGIGFDVALSKLDFSTSNRERQRSGDLRPVLTPNNRYTTHYNGFTDNTMVTAMSFLIFEASL